MNYREKIRTLLHFVGLWLCLCASPSFAQTQHQKWETVLAQARGQSVYWHAWSGDANINAYIDWVVARVAEDFGIQLTHVKIIDAAAAVQTIETEFAAGRRSSGGSIDLIWINGENFARLKNQGMLGRAFAQDLPNYGLLNLEDKITLRWDFSESVDGLESPWGLAQFAFLYDREQMHAFPGDAAALLAFAQAHPGRFAYPAPPAFVGTTFLKQLALDLLDDPALLYAPAPTGAQAQEQLAPLWAYMDALHPHLWRGGQAFPESHIELRDLYSRDEVDVLMTFNPADLAVLVDQGTLPPSFATAGFAKGSIGNAHFVAIPGNSDVRAAAQVVANFLLSAEAQARKADPAIWGDATVLDLDKLDRAARALFPAAIPQTGASVLEPHASWVAVLEAGWAAQYAR